MLQHDQWDCLVGFKCMEAWNPPAYVYGGRVKRMKAAVVRKATVCRVSHEKWRATDRMEDDDDEYDG